MPQTITGYECTLEQIQGFLFTHVDTNTYNAAINALEKGQSITLHGEWPFRNATYSKIIFQKTSWGYGMTFDNPIYPPYLTVKPQ